MEYMGEAEAEDDIENGEEEVGDDDDIGVDDGVTVTAIDKLKVDDFVFSPPLFSSVSVRSDVYPNSAP